MPSLKPNSSRIVAYYPHNSSKYDKFGLKTKLNLTIDESALNSFEEIEEPPKDIIVSSSPLTVAPINQTIMDISMNQTNITVNISPTYEVNTTNISVTITSNIKLNETTTSTSTTRKPNKILNSGPDELAALRVPGRPPMMDGDDWAYQVHAITTPKPYDARRDCGTRTLSREARIVGGRDSQLGELPWSVLIRETSLMGFLVKTKCGGVLIDLKWVLTAAHCKPGVLGSLIVVIGQNGISERFSTPHDSLPLSPIKLKPVVRKVKRMIIHRDYNPSNFDNDIALLELESPFQLQPHVVPICLPEKNEDFIGQAAMVAGWGKLSFGGPVPNVLQIANLPVIGNKECQDMYHNSGHMKIISDSFVCAGYPNGGKDSCEGDSGGPLQVKRNDSKWVLVGTVSHGIKCAEPNLPGIYIRTAAYLPWIKAVMFQQDQNKRYGHRLRYGFDEVHI